MIKERFDVDDRERYVGTHLKKLCSARIYPRPRQTGQAAETSAASQKILLKDAVCRSRRSPTQNASRNLAPEQGPDRSEVLPRPPVGQTRIKSQPADQPYENAYLFAAICPARGIGAA